MAISSLRSFFFFLVTAVTLPLWSVLDSHLPERDFSPERCGLRSVPYIACINLAHRREKKTRIDSLFTQHGVHVSFFPAVHGATEVNHRFFTATSCFLKKNHLTKGEIGCILSHYWLIKYAYENALDAIWIIEDDVDVVKDPHCIDELIEELNEQHPEWDMLHTNKLFYRNSNTDSKKIRGKEANNFSDWIFLLHGKASKRRSPKVYPQVYYKRSLPCSNTLKKITGRGGLQSYILSKKGIEKLYRYYRSLKWLFPIDIEVNFAPNLQLYSPTFDIVTQWFSATISDTKGIR